MSETTNKEKTPIAAYQIRFEFGWALNPTINWTNPRLKEIAIRQEALLKEHAALDQEILTIAQDYAKEKGITLVEKE